MRKLFLLLLVFPLISGTCEKDDMPNEEQCMCEIKGTNQISFDGGLTWKYSGIDNRTGLYYPCYFDGISTNEYTDEGGVKTRIYWECKH